MLEMTLVVLAGLATLVSLKPTARQQEQAGRVAAERRGAQRASA